MKAVLALVAAALLAWGPSAGMAQTPDASAATPEELLMLFQRQKSRGLKLAPNTAVTPAPDPVATGNVAAADAAPAEEGTTVQATAPTGLAAVEGSDAVVAVTYEEIDRADQVNIRIAFDFDSAVLRDSEKPKLTALCQAMSQIEGVFRIVGHTDASGSDAYNEKLSLLRAEEVKRHLVTVCGLPGARLQAVGVGKRFLYNTDDPGSEENRRVEFQALS